MSSEMNSVAVNTRMYFACLMVMFVAVGPILVMMLNLIREDNVDLFIGVFMAFFISISIMMFAWRRKTHNQELQNIENEIEKACDVPPSYESVVAVPPPYQNIQHQFLIPSYSSPNFIIHEVPHHMNLPSTSRWEYSPDVGDYAVRQELITYPPLSELPPYQSTPDISTGRPPDTQPSAPAQTDDENEQLSNSV